MSIPFTWVYLLYDPYTTLFKIGKSDDPEARHKQLCAPSTNGTIAAAPTNYQLVEAWLAPVPTEKSLHDYFQSVRVRGEWFDLTQHYEVACYESEEVAYRISSLLAKWPRFHCDQTTFQQESDSQRIYSLEREVT